jgi:hypothetical protein
MDWCRQQHYQIAAAEVQGRSSQALRSLAGRKRRLYDVPAGEDTQQPASFVHYRKPADLRVTSETCNTFAAGAG